MSTPLKKIFAKKSLGQHFLNNEYVPSRMVDAANVSEGDVVLEIGPGTGVLTRELLNRGAHVIALEADERAVEALNESFESEITAKKLVIFHKDVRDGGLGELGLIQHQYKLVANIPYYLSGKLFRTFLESDLQPSHLVFLVQKEVAVRIARDEKESLLSLSIKAYGEPLYVQTVKRGNFTPPPKIDSAIISIANISHDRFGEVDESFFFEILHLGFAAKRKQLLGNLSKKFDRGLLTNIFSTLGIHLSTRGEDLPLEKWLKLVGEIQIHSK
ncbi:16S rRNA (adenine(1518)-N(6)/adenine(1519)-N(6))-dimethyltransferase RsmA [bacterium]|nr:16S rRNA (adenine(1518)-N(6)/adenine(1519)-N(6))-dimethyltransferase RsmA [bacterium]